MNFFLLTFLLYGVSTSANEIKNYLELHSKFRREVCSKGTTRKYFDLLSLTRKTGNYVPINRGELNSFVVQKNLIILREKKEWITGIKKKVTNKRLSELRKEVSKIMIELDKVVEIKQAHWSEKNLVLRKKISDKSKKKVLKLESRLEIFFDNLFLLQTFDYPVDHLKMRGRYDSLKIRKDTLGTNLAQDLFFKRKIYEDGAPHPRWRGTDKSIRTLVNTIKLKLKHTRGGNQFISEDLRYDLNWLLDRIEKYLSYDASLIKRKLYRWERKVEDQVDFYNQLLSGKLKLKGRVVGVDDFIKDNLGAKSRLEDFIYEKQAQTYDFWTKQSEEMRRLFVSETIILNEVGGTPDPGDIEKEEVLKVVHKRSRLKFYSSLGGTKELLLKLKVLKTPTKEMKWLNTLFKKGEFSFTYYFIPGVRHIFCPDMSDKANKIREVALKKALQLKKENYNLPGVPVRYFSRQSMLGRIDMSKLWINFSALPEEPGPKMTSEEIERVSKNKNLYLYSFTSSDNKYFDVFLHEETYFVKNNLEGSFYHYRNPNFFKYFIEK